MREPAPAGSSAGSAAATTRLKGGSLRSISRCRELPAVSVMMPTARPPGGTTMESLNCPRSFTFTGPNIRPSTTMRIWPPGSPSPGTTTAAWRGTAWVAKAPSPTLRARMSATCGNFSRGGW